MIPPVVDASFLADHPEAVICDVRWYLDGRDGRVAFEDGHLRGAIWIDLEHDLAAQGLEPEAGRHPLPTAADFAAAMGRHGIGDDSTVVAYDDAGGMSAGRMVVMLRMLGHDAALLDGGLRGWTGPIERGPAAARAERHFTVVPWPADRLADADLTATLAADRRALVLDARAPERYTGAVTTMDPRPGHIPGALNAPWAAVLDERGFMRSADELRAQFEALGAHDVDAVVAYCGSGVSACLDVLALEHAGLRPPRLYVGSWSGWSADARRPAAIGG